MPTNWQSVREQLLASIGGAIVISLAGIAFNYVSNGGVVTLIGGVSKQELGLAVQEAITRITPKPGPPGERGLPGAGIEPGMIVAFGSKASIHLIDQHCPGGWVPFDEGRGRFIVGAGIPINPEFRDWTMQTTGEKRRLSEYTPLQAGGQEQHRLDITEIPPHDHSNGAYRYILKADNTATAGELDGKYAPGTREPNLQNVEEIREQGGGRPHPNLPPYVALYLCKKL